MNQFFLKLLQSCCVAAGLNLLNTPLYSLYISFRYLCDALLCHTVSLLFIQGAERKLGQMKRGRLRKSKACQVWCSFPDCLYKTLFPGYVVIHSWHFSWERRIRWQNKKNKPKVNDGKFILRFCFYCKVIQRVNFSDWMILCISVTGWFSCCCVKDMVVKTSSGLQCCL